ncbi:MAG TPA: hypothetical protein VK213_14130 [Bacteroidales bacterium]|nr:hypothetical protein [Bacteroidales bacterium]
MRLLLTAISLSVNTLTTPAKSCYFMHYRIDHGLSGNTVSNCIQDHGFMWLSPSQFVKN